MNEKTGRRLRLSSAAAVKSTGRRRGMMGFPGEPMPDAQFAWSGALGAETGGYRTMYVHIPFCSSRCMFCPFYSGTASDSEKKSYIRLLLRELEDSSRLPGIQDVPVNAVYFGGGTPTDLEAEDLEKLLLVLHRRYNLCNDCEITVEGRTSGFTADRMKACVGNGVNRFSIGVQTFDTGIRRSIGRKAQKKEVSDTLLKLLSFNQAAVVIDLLYGLPGQGMAQWIEDQRTVVEDIPISGLDHYRLNVHKGLELSRRISEGGLTLPSDEECYDMFRIGGEMLRDAGASRISISHYALDYRERNANNEISGRKNTCIPFGMRAGGRMGGYFFHQTSDPIEYGRMVSEGIKPLSMARKMPPDYRVCSELAGQIGKCRSINIQRAAMLDPERKQAIISRSLPLLSRWYAEGLLLPGKLGFMPLSDMAMFKHRAMAEELMETVASAYVEQETCNCRWQTRSSQ